MRRMAHDAERSALLVLHVWIEGAEADGLRARITQAADDSGGERTVGLASTVEEVVDCVRSWVSEFAGVSGGP